MVKLANNGEIMSHYSKELAHNCEIIIIEFY